MLSRESFHASNYRYFDVSYRTKIAVLDFVSIFSMHRIVAFRTFDVSYLSLAALCAPNSAPATACTVAGVNEIQI